MNRVATRARVAELRTFLESTAPELSDHAAVLEHVRRLQILNELEKTVDDYWAVILSLGMATLDGFQNWRAEFQKALRSAPRPTPDLRRVK